MYTGRPINFFDPLTAAGNALLPTFNTNGGTEPWRQWLLSTGWDGLQKTRRNKITGMPLTTSDRRWINNWIAKNGALQSQILHLMTQDDGYWDKKLKEYKNERGQQSQADFPIKEFALHRELDRIHDAAFEAAWAELQVYKERYTDLGQERRYRNLELRRGNTKGAAQTQKRVKQLQQEVRR